MNKHGVILKFSIITPWNKQKWFKVQLKTVLWCDSTTQQVLSVCVFVYFIICIYIISTDEASVKNGKYLYK